MVILQVTLSVSHHGLDQMKSLIVQASVRHQVSALPVSCHMNNPSNQSRKSVQPTRVLYEVK